MTDNSNAAREIKFRAWDTEKHEWCGANMSYADDIHGPISKPVVFDGQGKCVIMQYTGLKDKNGVEIYEGDILHIDWCDFHSTVWDKSRLKVVYHNASFSIDKVPLEQATCDAYEVIGNIYENRELLK